MSEQDKPVTTCMKHLGNIERPVHVATASHDGIDVTEVAKLYIEKQLQKRGKGIGLRIVVKPSGCSGLQYELDYVDQESVGDKVFPFTDSLAVYVDPKSYQYIKGSTLDFVSRDLGEFLQLNNPNEKTRCGCGRSFSV